MHEVTMYIVASSTNAIVILLMSYIYSIYLYRIRTYSDPKIDTIFRHLCFELKGKKCSNFTQELNVN